MILSEFEAKIFDAVKNSTASMLSYNQTIMSMLGERKKVKHQIAETFGADKNLFGEKILSQNV